MQQLSHKNNVLRTDHKASSIVSSPELYDLVSSMQPQFKLFLASPPMIAQTLQAAYWLKPHFDLIMNDLKGADRQVLQCHTMVGQVTHQALLSDNTRNSRLCCGSNNDARANMVHLLRAKGTRSLTCGTHARNVPLCSTLRKCVLFAL